MFIVYFNDHVFHTYYKDYISNTLLCYWRYGSEMCYRSHWKLKSLIGPKSIWWWNGHAIFPSIIITVKLREYRKDIEQEKRVINCENVFSKFKNMLSWNIIGWTNTTFLKQIRKSDWKSKQEFENQKTITQQNWRKLTWSQC